MRLIDADAMTDNIKQGYKLNMNGVILSANDMIEAVDNAPTIDLWHYPSRGEYPPKGKQILAYAWNVHNVLAKYDTFNGKDVFVTFDAYNGFIEVKKVIRWQYIVPPKE